MRKSIHCRTVEHKYKLVAEGDTLVFYIDNKAVISFDLIDVWDLVTDRMANLSFSNNPGLLRRSYAAKQLPMLYKKYLEMVEKSKIL